jgi:iron complex transport system substrate-binding protein
VAAVTRLTSAWLRGVPCVADVVRRAEFFLVVAVVATGTVSAAPPEATDDTGAIVRLAAPAQRIVSLAPHATELLFAAGAGTRVVGVIGSSDWPPEARTLPVVGDSRALDLERIVALAPDLVVAWPYTPALQVAALRARGIPVFNAEPRSIDGIAADVERLGVLAGTESQATPRAAALRARHALLRARNAGQATVRVFYQIWNVPLYTIGGRHLINEAIGLCGGENVFAALTTPAPVVSIEAVLAAAPDAIVAGAERGVRPDWLDDWRRWPALRAAAQGHLFVVNADLLHRAGPRFLDGVDELCAAIDAARREHVLDPPVRPVARAAR